MSGVHKYPTISFRVSDRERDMIESKILASGMQKKDYFVRSCIYNRICVVGKKEVIYQLVEELQNMQTNISKLVRQLEQQDVTLTDEGLEDMRNDCMDMNRANEARDMTKKMGALAEKYQCAILLIGHMNKASGNKAAYRGMGSIDFFAVARSVLLVGRVEGEPNIRALVQIKNNLAQFGHPKAFELMERGFKWMGDYGITADEVLGGIAPKANKLEQAKRMLRELAETSNAVQSNEIFDMAEEQGISKRTLENAKKELCIRARKINNSWYWELDKIKQI